jgi:hypothetical protein
VYGSRPSDPGTEPEPPGQYSPDQPPHANEIAWGQNLPSNGSGPLSLEGSGSLTGHILAQGRPDEPESRPRGPRTVIIVLVTILVLAVAAGLGAILVITGTL